MLSVPLNADTERRLAELAKRRGQSDAELARDLLVASIEDLDDVPPAESRLAAREPTIALSERDSLRVLEILENPPQAPPRLVRAAKAIRGRE